MKTILRRVAITGMGIVSSIGKNCEEVHESLYHARSGISYSEEHKKLGFRSHVHGAIGLDLEEALDRRTRRFMGDGVMYNYLAMEEALAQSGLERHELSDPRSGIVMGSGGPSTRNQVLAVDTLRQTGSTRKIGPYMVPRVMSSTNSAVLATLFQIKGVNYSISSACSTSAHCIGHAAELIQWNKQDIVCAGGGEELHWTLSAHFDAMGALSSHHNHQPERASRAYDAGRDGFVISGGGGVLVLEEWERARSRGAEILAELVGYGATADGHDMVQPSGEGAERCMRLAHAECGNRRIEYINTHGTSTPIGDRVELEALRKVFGEHIPPLSSTKSLTGHALGAAGVHEAIYTLIMMRKGFQVESAHIESLEEGMQNYPILRQREDKGCACAMTNSFGFGGTNSSLIFAQPE